MLLHYICLFLCKKMIFVLQQWSKIQSKIDVISVTRWLDYSFNIWPFTAM